MSVQQLSGWDHEFLAGIGVRWNSGPLCQGDRVAALDCHGDILGIGTVAEDADGAYIVLHSMRAVRVCDMVRLDTLLLDYMPVGIERGETVMFRF